MAPVAPQATKYEISTDLVDGDVCPVVDVVLESSADEGVDAVVLVADGLSQVGVEPLDVLHGDDQGALLGLDQLPSLLQVLELVAFLPFLEEILEELLASVADLVGNEVGVVGGGGGDVHLR